MKIERAKLRVPVSLYPSLIVRLQSLTLDEGAKSFLGARCDRAFLRLILEARADILVWAAEWTTKELSSGSKLLLAALTSYGLLPEASRARIVERVHDHSMTWLDANLLQDKILQQIFTADEFQDFAQQFRREWLHDLPNLFDKLRGRFSSDDEITLYKDFKESLQSAEHFYADESIENKLLELYAQLDAHISDLEDKKPDSPPSMWQPSTPTAVDVTPLATSAHSGTIFDEVDD